MADNNEVKTSPLQNFKKKLSDKTQLVAIVTEGLQSTNAKVRSLAVKIALRSQDSAFIKKNITPLLKNEKSKKVLRSIAKRITRADLLKKLESMKAAKKEAKAAPAGEAPAGS